MCAKLLLLRSSLNTREKHAEKEVYHMYQVYQIYRYIMYSKSSRHSFIISLRSRISRSIPSPLILSRLLTQNFTPLHDRDTRYGRRTRATEDLRAARRDEIE